jgi:hypothetical protein
LVLYTTSRASKFPAVAPSSKLTGDKHNLNPSNTVSVRHFPLLAKTQRGSIMNTPHR